VTVGPRLARLHDEPDYAERWKKAADEIHADILARGLDARGVFVQHYDTAALDASVLLLPLVRFLPADDERVRNTVLAVADELTVDGLVLRYRTDQTDDGLPGEEATFTICSFWLVSALVEIGEVARARQLCEKLLSYATPSTATPRSAAALMTASWSWSGGSSTYSWIPADTPCTTAPGSHRASASVRASRRAR